MYVYVSLVFLKIIDVSSRKKNISNSTLNCLFVLSFLKKTCYDKGTIKDFFFQTKYIQPVVSYEIYLFY